MVGVCAADAGLLRDVLRRCRLLLVALGQCRGGRGLVHGAGDDDADLVQQPEWHGQQELRQHIGRSEDGAHHEGADDHIGADFAQFVYSVRLAGMPPPGCGL